VIKTKYLVLGGFALI